MCISGGMSALTSVPLGREKREVTVEILYPQIFAGINAFNPQGQIKYESKNKVQVVKNGEQWLFLPDIMKIRFMDYCPIPSSGEANGVLPTDFKGL